MAERGWFLDIVQEFVNYEMKVGRLQDELKQTIEANKLLSARVKFLESPSKGEEDGTEGK